VIGPEKLEGIGRTCSKLKIATTEYFHMTSPSCGMEGVARVLKLNPLDLRLSQGFSS
jgi:hypothetical protein